MLPFVDGPAANVGLAGRAGVNCVELRTVLSYIGQGVRLDERERIARLRLDVHPDHVEPRTVVAHRGSPGFTEQIQ